ncbi:hypothetical protein EG329_005964 [Mollisiaceae sp. DMI_Dod_QoI]|nr:hypothetical protein EG329_005964 [Helotiales sp. DMI_Dod_QoI]
MVMKEAVKTDKAPPPMPFFSQAIKCGGMVYCSGSIGMDPTTSKIVEGSVADRAAQSLKNLAAVLEAAGSSIDNAVKVNVFLTNMEDFAAMNKVYEQFFTDPQENWAQKLWPTSLFGQNSNKRNKKGAGRKQKNMKSTPNPRNSPSKIKPAKVIWAEQKRKEDDPREHAAQALKSLDGVTFPDKWTEELPVLLSQSIAAVLQSVVKTEEDEAAMKAQIQALETKAARAVRKPTITNKDEEIIQPSDDGSVGGNNRNGGEGGSTNTPKVKKRRFDDFKGREENQKLLNDALIREPAKKQKLSNEIQTQAPTDLAQLNPQPIRLNYDPHPLEDQSDEWFMEMFKKLYAQTERFVIQFYGLHDLDQGVFFEPWTCGVSPEFISWAEQVAEPDPAVGGWDMILRNTEQRQWFIMGILTKIIQKKVFDEELFGANEQQYDLMHGLDRALFQREGFSRQALRSETVRTIIGRAPVTEHFYRDVAQLTARVSLLLHPLTSYLYGLAPPDGTTTPKIIDLYQALHSLISNAAYLSIAVRLSPTIFYFTPLSPGDTYDANDHLNFSMLAYTISKQTVIDNHQKATDAYSLAAKPKERTYKRLVRAGREHTAEGNAAFTQLQEVQKTAPQNPGSTHRALVGIASWPVVTRFKAGGEEDDERCAD